jgi:cystathionine beta-lyase/cystathionine gamma-synthase
VPTPESSAIQSYLDRLQAPVERPELAWMSEKTRSIHERIDARMRFSHSTQLLPEGPSVQTDLFGSESMTDWQETKAATVFEGEQCWSELPQVYARYGTETTAALIREMKAIEHARGVIVCDCGMQACALLFDVVVLPGAHVVLSRQVYNKTKKYLERVAGRIGTEITVVDDGDEDALARAIRPDTCLVFAETYTNPLLRAIDPERLGAFIESVRKTRAPRIRLVVDSTIASPWGTKKPLLDYPGIDFVVASGTKALGCADTHIWGYIASNRVDALNEVMDLQAMRGGILHTSTARDVLESLRGNSARESFIERSRSATRIAAFLSGHPRVSEVFHPSLPQHPDRQAIERHYAIHGSLLSFRVRDADEDTTRHFSDVLATCIVPRYALSFDGTTTKVNHHTTVSEYFTPREELERAGIDRLVRLGVGQETADDLIACLNWSLWRHSELSSDDVRAWQRARRQSLGMDPAPRAG